MEDPIVIIVKAEDNQEHQIQVLPSETFLQVKEKVKEITNIEVDKQGLKFNGIEVIDEYTIEFYEIKDGMKIELVTINPPNRNHNQPNHNLIRITPPADYEKEYLVIKTEDGSTLAQLKLKIQEFANIPAGRIKLFHQDREMNDDLLLTTEFVTQSEIEIRVSENDDNDEDD